MFKTKADLIKEHAECHMRINYQRERIAELEQELLHRAKCDHPYHYPELPPGQREGDVPSLRARIAELEAENERLKREAWPCDMCEQRQVRIAELEAVVAEVRRLRQEFVNSAGNTVSFGPLWRALDSLDSHDA